MTYAFFDDNKVGDDYVVGDIHGCYAFLEEELSRVGFQDTKDRLFCVGDLVDRGPESEKVLEYLKKPWFFSIKGNHEDMIISAFDIPEILCTMEARASRNGNLWWLNLPRDRQKLFVDAFCKLPHIIEIAVGNKFIGLVHAELPLVPGGDWQYFINTKDGRTLDSMLWGRAIVQCSGNTQARIPNVEGIDLVIHGHSIVSHPKQIANRLYIDTGINKLTILKLKDLICEF